MVLPRLSKKQFETIWVPQILILLTCALQWLPVNIANSQASPGHGAACPAALSSPPYTWQLAPNAAGIHLSSRIIYTTAPRESKLPSVFTPPVPVWLRRQLFIKAPLALQHPSEKG